MRFGWAAVAILGPPAGGMALSHAFSKYFAVFISAALIGAALSVIRRVHRGGEPLLATLIQGRQRARARVDSAAKLRAVAPLVAGALALCSFPAVLLALVATGSFGARGVDLPPVADPRCQLWCIAIAAAGIVVALDCWVGFGTCARALAGDGFTVALVGITVALAAASPVMILLQVESRPAWLTVMALQFTWLVAGAILGTAVSQRRKRPLLPHPLPPDSWFATYGIEADTDVVLVSPGSRKILVIKAVRTLTGLGLKEAKDLIDRAPGLIMHRVTSERADNAREVLESLGATVTVTTAGDGLMIVKPLPFSLPGLSPNAT
jgi:hypothetical protein